MRLPFANSFSRTQQVRRLIGAGLLTVTILMCIGGVIFWDALAAARKLFVWYWTLTFLGAWGGIAMAVWDFLDIARQSAVRRRELLHDHFTDEDFLRQLRERTGERKKSEEEPR